MLRIFGQDVRQREREIVADQIVGCVAGEDAGEDAAAVTPVGAIDVTFRRLREVSV